MGGSLSRQREEPFADADGGSRRTQRLLGDARWRNSLQAHQPYEKKEKEWERQSIDVCSTAQSGNEPLEHAEQCPTTPEILLRKWQRYCVKMRLFSFVCVKRWSASLHCFSFGLQSNHPETQSDQTQNAARTRQSIIEFYTSSMMRQSKMQW